MSVDTATVRRIARDGMIWGYPLVDSFRIQHSYFVDSNNREFKAPWNRLNHEARVYTAADTALQTPNSDTPYSQLGADLRTEPLVLSVPKIEGRYYSLQLVDMYTHNFAYIGSRATGGEAADFLLAGPGWSGEVPAGIKQIIRCETQFAFVLYRTQLIAPDDIENVKVIQAQFRVTPLSGWLGHAPPPSAPTIDFPSPPNVEDQRSSLRFFEMLAFVLQFCPEHPDDAAMRADLARIGVKPGSAFNPEALPRDMSEALAAGMADAWQAYLRNKKENIDTGLRGSADSFGTREFLAGDHMARMSAAILGIYGNSHEEAIYPNYLVDADRKPLSGASRYRIRFPKGGLPPVNAFWSLTLYRMPESLLHDNPLNRYLINSSMLPDLRVEEDGSLVLEIQHDAPEVTSSWLPAPKGPFWMVMRLYWPKDEAATGQWKLPVLEKMP